MIRIAIQKKGRLSDSSQSYLKNLGLQFKPNGRQLLNCCLNADVELLYLRASDIPEYVNRGVADFGIVGQNTLLEKNKKAEVIKRLGFAKCSLNIAIPVHSKMTSLKDLEGERIATSYPNLLRNYLKENKVKASIIPLSGSVEIAPKLNLADAICDLVQTSTTLKENGLKSFVTLLNSEAVLIKSPNTNKTFKF